MAGFVEASKAGWPLQQEPRRCGREDLLPAGDDTRALGEMIGPERLPANGTHQQIVGLGDARAGAQ
ncbi:MAG TPA: hypothetical protein VMG12_14550 [Polyangiaceae bacterium]|nr:hypothetical protein [Polyangiaceae bacterium]